LEQKLSELNVLIDLGLTAIQAKVYLALVNSGPLKISAISKISNVARPDVYSTLSKLQKLCLVEKIIEKPLKYRATPIKIGLSLLLKTKTDQYKRVRAKTQILLDTAKPKQPKEKKQIENPQFVLIPKGKNVVYRLQTAIEKAKVSINLVLSWKRFSRGIVNDLAESIERALAKNVKIQFIIESPLENKTAKQLVQFCDDKPFCQLRFLRDKPEKVFGIYDEKEVFIIVNPKADLPGSSALWSCNPALIAIAKDSFEKLWLTATKNNL
jgi:sugar-specific transcriptional regulator TrmB